ncbi:hypothetical protein WJX73_007017 [Symbiochloris irregularis]|uniref:FAD-binding domain-containing protein n=1 Tax=Symbiochloris irregularis TaxID=706552 RepID=A0AAW1NP85_9CHLO
MTPRSDSGLGSILPFQSELQPYIARLSILQPASRPCLHTVRKRHPQRPGLIKQTRLSPTTAKSGHVTADSNLLQADRPQQIRAVQRHTETTKGTAMVIGAGPAGALSAIVLAQDGFAVEVYEQRALPDPMHRNFDRSYSLAVGHRGLGALEKVGVNMQRYKEPFPYKGSMNMWREGHVTEHFHDPITSKALVERMELVRHLIDEAHKLCGDKITWHWQHACEEVDLQHRRVTFSNPAGKKVSAAYDLLLGADGVNSRVRGELERQVPDYKGQWYGRMHRIDKFFHQIAPGPDEPAPQTPRGELDSQASVLRFYHIKSPAPLSIGLMHVHNHANGTYSGGLGFSRGSESREDPTGGVLSHQGDYEAVLQQLDPIYPPGMRKKMAEQMAQRPWFFSGSTLQVPRLHHGRVLLLGDAAHAVSASVGQGVNAALEDCSMLGQALLNAPEGQEIDQLLSRYDKERYADVYALGHMHRFVSHPCAQTIWNALPGTLMKDDIALIWFTTVNCKNTSVSCFSCAHIS